MPNDHLEVKESHINYGKMKIIPNPGSDHVSFTLEGNNDRIRDFTVYDVFGRMVISGRIAGDNRDIIDISRLSSGLYVLIVKTSDKIYSGKIIKS